jgi:hypothetical protein
MKNIYLRTLFLFLITPYCFFSQDEFDFDADFELEEVKTFNSTRIISGHSVETLPEKTFEMRIEHRFGDIAGENGGYQTLFGFDNVSDMRIALEYGITDKLMLGFGRSKGTSAPYSSLLDGFIKYRVLTQKEGGAPISISVGGGSTFTYREASMDMSDVAFFPKVSHRFCYYTQLNMAYRLKDIFSVAIMPTLVHRNYVSQNDVNELFSLGAAMRLKLSKKFFLLMEYYPCFHNNEFRQEKFFNSLGIALEWKTFGHNFTINFTNSKGLGETQFIPYTYENWLDGQFRLGFCVSRQFSFDK